MNMREYHVYHVLKSGLKVKSEPKFPTIIMKWADMQLIREIRDAYSIRKKRSVIWF